MFGMLEQYDKAIEFVNKNLDISRELGNGEEEEIKEQLEELRRCASPSITSQ